jgi:ribosomal protein L11 methyltransferase
VADPVGWRVVAEVPAAEVELVSDRCFQLGALGIEEQDAPYDRVLLLVGMPDEASAEAVASGLDGASVQPVRDDGWADEWRAWARPVRVGHVVVRPAWLPGDDGADGRTAVSIDPGRSFGSGSHESTKLALVMLQDLGAIESLLDVGCGSGVLGIAMARLHGTRVTAIDIEAHAVDVTHANAVANGVGHLVHASTTPLSAIAGTFEVVVANILAVTLRELAVELARVVAVDGHVVLSGMLQEQGPSVDAACIAAGLRPVARVDSGEWTARSYGRERRAHTRAT